MVNWAKVHVGQHRQWIPPEEAAAYADLDDKAKDALPVLGITADLHAPEIVNPADAPEMNLHGDVEGSPYSANPGEISLSEAAEKAKGDVDPSGDMVETRAREFESQRTGVPTEQLAAEEEGDQPPPRARTASQPRAAADAPRRAADDKK